MSSEEFSNQFDVYFNNITDNQAPGLTEYEKSLFLTKAQDEKIKNHFNPKGNKYGEGFDDSQKRQMDFSKLMFHEEKDADEIDEPIFDTRTPNKSVYLPDDLWIIINERVKVIRGGKNVDLTVKPINYAEYDRLMSKPYKRPLKHQAWRLIISELGSDGNSRNGDLIVGPTDNITSYSVRYIKKPKPIIIGPLDGLTIDGYVFSGDRIIIGGTNDNPVYAPETEGCELDEIMHEEILQRAVELAKVAWTQTGQDNTQAVIQAGQRSE